MKHPSFEQESSIMPEFTIGNYLATRLEQIGINYFMAPQPLVGQSSLLIRGRARSVPKRRR